MGTFRLETPEELETTTTQEEQAPAPKRRGRKPKAASTEAATPVGTSKASSDAPTNGGKWSMDLNANKTNLVGVPTYKMYVEIEWLRPALALTPGDKELYSSYIASKAPDAQSLEEKLTVFSTDEVERRSTTIFPVANFIYDPETDHYIDSSDKITNVTAHSKTDNLVKVPFIYDYQIRGMFKDACGLLTRADKKGGTGVTKSSSMTAYKKVIDGSIFVEERHVAIHIPEQYVSPDDGETICDSYDENGRLAVLQRPLRTSGPSGDTVCIASSEMIPPGSSMKFCISMINKSFKPFVEEWLNYGAVHGFSAWRNSGMGIFRWRELKSDYTPYD